MKQVLNKYKQYKNKMEKQLQEKGKIGEESQKEPENEERVQQTLKEETEIKELPKDNVEAPIQAFDQNTSNSKQKEPENEERVQQTLKEETEIKELPKDNVQTKDQQQYNRVMSEINLVLAQFNITAQLQDLKQAIFQGEQVQNLYDLIPANIRGRELRNISSFIQSQNISKIILSQKNKSKGPIKYEKILSFLKVNQISTHLEELASLLVSSRNIDQAIETISKQINQNISNKIKNISKNQTLIILIQSEKNPEFAVKIEKIKTLFSSIPFGSSLSIRIVLNQNIDSILYDIMLQMNQLLQLKWNQIIVGDQYKDLLKNRQIQNLHLPKIFSIKYRTKTYFSYERTLVKESRQVYDIPSEYSFVNAEGIFMTQNQQITCNMEVVKSQQFSLRFLDQEKYYFLPVLSKISEVKPFIKKILNTNFDIVVLFYKNTEFVEQPETSCLKDCVSKRISISFYVNLEITIKQDLKTHTYRTVSCRSVAKVKQELQLHLGIKKQAQKWLIEGQQVIEMSESLEEIGINRPQFIIMLIQIQSFEYHGFQKHYQILPHQFQNFYIEDDEVFTQYFKKKRQLSHKDSQVFRRQSFGYIFNAIKKHSPIKEALKHIQNMVENVGVEQKLWKTPTLNENQKCLFNETFVLYNILNSSKTSLRIDILKSLISNMPVPLTITNANGKVIPLFQENYWILNKSFTISSFGLGETVGKSSLLNVIFQTNFQKRDDLHRQCQGGIQIQYNIYENNQYSVNLIDISNNVQKQLKVDIAKASNLVIIHTLLSQREVNNWLNQNKLSVPVIIFFRDDDKAFSKEQRNKQAVFNNQNKQINMYQIIKLTEVSLRYYSNLINQITDSVQIFVRKHYERQTGNLWKFSDYLATGKGYSSKNLEKLNNLLKGLANTTQNLTRITQLFYDYKKLEYDRNIQNQKLNSENMEIKKKLALELGIAKPLQEIISFYKQNSNLSSQLMGKIRSYLTLLRNELFRDFNRMQYLQNQMQKSQARFKSKKSQFLERIININKLPQSMTTEIIKQSTTKLLNILENCQKFQDCQAYVKIIKVQFQFEVQPKAFSVENFWREVIYMNKFDPKYTFKLENEQQIQLKSTIIQFGKKEIHNSQNFQLINGDLLQMPTEYLKSIFQLHDDKKVMVVAIFGPQSSGKSTLLNFVLGCDFMSSSGRCTKGIYGTYFEISNRNIPNCQAILVLDTEGLFSNYQNPKFQNRKGFDNKLVLFCLQVCDLIIFNSRGDVTSECQNLLELSLSSQMLDYNKLPDIYFVLNMNGGDISSQQRKQIQKFCNVIVETNPGAKSIFSGNRSVGMPMAFNQVPRKNSSQYVIQFLLTKNLPSQKFYKKTKQLCFNLMQLLSERGLQKDGRNMEQIFLKMDQTWAIINKYPILTKHTNKKIKKFEEEFSQWKKQKKQRILKFLQQILLELEKVSLTNLQEWERQKQQELQNQIQSCIKQYHQKFLEEKGEEKLNIKISENSAIIEPTLKTQISNFKAMIQAKRLLFQIEQSKDKGFHKINYEVKKIERRQLSDKILIPQQQKQLLFQKCFNQILKQKEEKLNRKQLSLKLYENITIVYNGCLRSNQTRQDIKAQSKLIQSKLNTSSLKSIDYQIQNKNIMHLEFQANFIDYFKTLVQRFKKNFENDYIFEASQESPIMNIQKDIGICSFQYLDMSKYFQIRPIPTYIKTSLYSLNYCLQSASIKTFIQDKLQRNNLYSQFINILILDIKKLGFEISYWKIEEIVKKNLSNFFLRGIYSLTGSTVISEYNLYQINQVALSNKKKKKQFNYKILEELVYLKQYKEQFLQYLDRKIRKDGFQFSQDLLKKVVVAIANKAIEDFAQRVKQNQIINQQKRIVIDQIIQTIQKDLNSLNLKVSNPIVFNQEQFTQKIVIEPIQKQYVFQSQTEFKKLINNFSSFWNIQKLKKNFSFHAQQQKHYYEYSSSYAVIGKFIQNQISVKQQYAQNKILKRYIKKEYDQFLNQMKTSNFVQFIKNQVQYQKAFEKLKNKIIQQKIYQKELTKSVSIVYSFVVNQIISELDKDLKQVSQRLRYNFKAELHGMAANLIWKIQQQYQKIKIQNILEKFKLTKQSQKRDFLDRLSLNPAKQNQATATIFIKLYTQMLNSLIQADKEEKKKSQTLRIKKQYSRKQIQIQIDGQLVNSQDIGFIMKYLTEPNKFTKEKYQRIYTENAEKLNKLPKFTKHTQIIDDLIKIIVELKNSVGPQQNNIPDEIFEGERNTLEQKQNSIIRLFAQVILKGQVINNSINIQKLKIMKIREGRTFKILNILKDKNNVYFIERIKNMDIRITNLRYFLDSLVVKLQQLRMNNTNLEIDFTQQQIKAFRQSLYIKVCQQTCPCCKRNCDVDQQNDQNLNHTKHRCKSGHQMRAIRGMKVELQDNGKIKYEASIQRCEDMDQDSVFTFDSHQYTWKQFKAKYTDWDLQFTQNNRKADKAVFNHCWKLAGQKICQQHTKNGNQMTYVQYNADKIIEHKKIVRSAHYIFGLDESGSMDGEPWKNLMSSMQTNMAEIAKVNRSKNQSVSIFKFNDGVTLVTENADPKSFGVNQITYGGGGTTYTPAFKLARQLIQKNKSVDNYFIFISDGEAEYPESQIRQINRLQEQFKAKNLLVKYVSILIGSGGQLMERIKTQLNGQHLQVANSIQVQTKFKEILKTK